MLDLATATGLLVGAFSERGHAVTGLDVADKLLNRARQRFPGVDFRNQDLAHLDRIATGAYGLVSMGYRVSAALTQEIARLVREEG